ncbi:hypothetical protein OUZ56_032653 [Daphnia magna]|uniref:Uncharacterized protein n=1 Tax=Daphnia magna TaxID=35525 RepID=A0ABR0B9J7_9CRUS|nr:hypothetical protein OUZ56_032653 [Daphnia magna]
MVRAILEGRKTQTRRPIKSPWSRAPFAVGDRLWVRETWVCVRPMRDSEGTVDDEHESRDPQLPRRRTGRPLIVRRQVAPSIHMPRWASRLTLEVTDIRPEHIQSISPEDAIAEGLNRITKDGTLYKFGIADRDGLPGTDDDGWP